MQTYDNVAERLMVCRKKTGMSREEFCDTHKLAFTKYSQYENGNRRVPAVAKTEGDRDNIEYYAKIFGVSPAWILWGIQDKTPLAPNFIIANNSGDPLFTKGGVIYYEKRDTPKIGVYGVAFINDNFFIGTCVSFVDFVPINKDIKPFTIKENDYAGTIIRYEKDF